MEEGRDADDAAAYARAAVAVPLTAVLPTTAVPFAAVVPTTTVPLTAVLPVTATAVVVPAATALTGPACAATGNAMAAIRTLEMRESASSWSFRFGYPSRRPLRGLLRMRTS